MADVDDNVNLEKLVNSVDYVKFGEGYVPSKFALKFISFIKLVNGEMGEENKSPLFHYDILDTIYRCKNVLIVSFRGSAKTTLTGEYMVLYLATFGTLEGFGDVNVIMYVGDTMENGCKNLRANIEHRYRNSEFLQKFIPTVRFTDAEMEFTNAEGHQLCVKLFGANPLSLDTKLYTETGYTTIGECKVGDKIYGANGKLCTIEKKSEVFNRPVYRIVTLDGRELKVSDNHINRVIYEERSWVKYKDTNLHKTELDILTKDLCKLELRLPNTNRYRAYLPMCKPLEYCTRELEVDPYTLGLLLGDGSLKTDGSCTLTANQDDLQFYKTQIPHQLGNLHIDKRHTSVHDITVKGISDCIRKLGLSGTDSYSKFIPEEYFLGSVTQRLSLLQGLMDTDGTVTVRKNTYKASYCTTSEQLAKDVQRLVWSLGGWGVVGKNKHKNTKFADYYRVGIHLNLEIFRLPRKLEKLKLGYWKNAMVPIVKIEQIEDEPTQCIGVANEDHLFVAEDYLVTHNTGVRGFKKYGMRPQIAILDDLMSDKSAESKTITRDIENVIYKAVRQAMHPSKRKVIWIGTPFNKSDPLYKAAGTVAWTTKAYPICKKFPCDKKEFVGAWEDRFPYETVKSEYAMLKANGRVDAFNQELMLRILSDDDRLVLDEDIIWYKRSKVLDNLNEYNVYITTDFATSEKEQADFSVISVWAVDFRGVFHWIDGIVKRQDMAKNVDDIFRLVQIYKPLATGVEISGQQKGFVSWLKREMSIRGVYFYLASDKASGEEGLRPTTSKLVRFNTALPLFKQRKIAFPEELKDSPAIMEFIDEITSVTPSGFKSEHDDCADTISQIPLIEYFSPIDPKIVKPEKKEIDYGYDSRYFIQPDTEEYQSSYIV